MSESESTAPTPQSLVSKELLTNDKKDELLSQAINSVCRPVLANLMRDPENPKFGTVRCGNAKIAAALSFKGVPSWFKLAGFVDETNEKGEQILLWRGGGKDYLNAANCALSVVEDAIEEEKQAKFLQPKNTTRTLKAEQEKEEAKARIKEQVERDRLAVEAEQKRKQQEEQKALLEKQDFEEVKHLEEVAKKTLHYHGRIRNASFNAEHFKLRRMANGRAHVCGKCPNECIEAHWHVRNAALLYSYVVHLNPDATEVLHQGPEDGYQYNSLPGTPHFGKTLFISTKTVDEATGQVNCQTPNTAVEFCRHCMVSFKKLAV